jgi:hypothetical protein
MMEYLVFMDTARIKELHMGTLICPGAIRLPFLLRQVGEEMVTALDGRTYDCLVYETEWDSFLSVFVKLFYGSAKVWVMKDFPHIRVKMDFFKKIVLMRDATVTWRSPVP